VALDPAAEVALALAAVADLGEACPAEFDPAAVVALDQAACLAAFVPEEFRAEFAQAAASPAACDQEEFPAV
jgi:hypothetical protein